MQAAATVARCLPAAQALHTSGLSRRPASRHVMVVLPMQRCRPARALGGEWCTADCHRHCRCHRRRWRRLSSLERAALPGHTFLSSSASSSTHTVRAASQAVTPRPAPFLPCRQQRGAGSQGRRHQARGGARGVSDDTHAAAAATASATAAAVPCMQH